MSDLFVALPPVTSGNCVLFAKNADRPPSEVQEVIYLPPEDHAPGTKVKCTFLELSQVPHTHGVVLSKAAWSWGSEMGANDQGLCGGCVSVWTRLCHPGDHEEKLLGCDLVRLALERSRTAREAVDTVTSLLGRFGQGGPCCEDPSYGQWTYHNSFLFADRQQAWALQTAGTNWVAKKITGPLVVSDLFEVLRHKDSSINMCGELLTVASQVSMVQAPGSPQRPDVHWMTATPDPDLSTFKPFIFCPQPCLGKATLAPTLSTEGRVRSGSQTCADRRHLLYRMHEQGREAMESGSSQGRRLLDTMRSLERQCVKDVAHFLHSFTPALIEDVRDLFKDITESEVKFYK